MSTIERAENLDKAIEKLHRYEATGLEPETVEKLAKMLDRGAIVLTDALPGDTVYEIRSKYTKKQRGKVKAYDHSIMTYPARLENEPDTCYVHEKTCTKSDLYYLGRTVFATREDAEETIEEARKALEARRNRITF